MTTPALAAVRASLPGVHLTLLSSPAGAAAAPHLEMVDEVWAFQAPWMQHGDNGSPDIDSPASELGQDEARLIERLAAGHFDAAVIFTVCTQSALPAALLCRLAGIPLRLAHSRENPYGLLTDWVRDTDDVVAGLPQAEQQRRARHEVERQLALVGAVGLHTRDERLRFRLRPRDHQPLARLLGAGGITPNLPYVVIHPGASAASRRWPAERFGAVARALTEQGLAVVLSGGPHELALVDSVLRSASATSRPALPVISLAGGLTLGELAALIDGACVLVANNSVPAHLAAALGTPVVNLYALTNPQHMPWRVESRVLTHDVPCRWCLKSVCPQGHHACLLGVDPPQVVAAALQLMQLMQLDEPQPITAAAQPMQLDEPQVVTAAAQPMQLDEPQGVAVAIQLAQPMLPATQVAA
jgi:ADP-heptose:LPS heptosyltransferase